MAKNSLGISSHAKRGKPVPQMHQGQGQAQPFPRKEKSSRTFVISQPESGGVQGPPMFLPHQQGRNRAFPTVGSVQTSVGQESHETTQRSFRRPPVWDIDPESSTNISSPDRRMSSIGPDPIHIATTGSRGDHTDLSERHGSQRSIDEYPLADNHPPRNTRKRCSTAYGSAAEFADPVSMTSSNRDIRSAPNPPCRPMSAPSQHVHNHDPLDTHVRNQLHQTQEFRKDAQQFHKELIARLEKAEQSKEGIKDTVELLFTGQIGVLKRVDEMQQEQHLSCE